MSREFQFEKARARLAVINCIKLAEKLYPEIEGALEDVKVLFNLRGRAAAQARVHHRDNRREIRINVEAYSLRPQEMLEDTVPHEVAHLVCNILGNDRGHGANWKRVCKELGGTGETHHDMKLTPARRQKKFLYRNDDGIEVHFKQGRHSNLQLGKVKAYARTDGRSWRKEHFISEIVDTKQGPVEVEDGVDN